MSRFDYSKDERDLNRVIKYQEEYLKKLNVPSASHMDSCIMESEKVLKALNISVDKNKYCCSNVVVKPVTTVPSWEDLCNESKTSIKSEVELEDLFSVEELKDNQEIVTRLNKEYNAIHRLDKFDILIASTAGLVGALIDILLVGIPKKTYSGLKGGPLSNYVRDWFDRKFPEEEMQKLANSKMSKVPYDAQDNRNTKIWVEGLSSFYHRLLSLGHDPILGFVVGVLDILQGSMTTVDKKGNLVIQVMENYSNRKESDFFLALSKQLLHLKSDVTTSMGLPVPFMNLFNFFLFGKVGEYEQTVAEIVQGMYYEGYDFIHFCSMSIPVMVSEVFVRVLYALKRIKEGFSVKESIPFSTNHAKHPKLGTMLFVAHSVATTINAGKVFFTKNPMAINYPQWLVFFKYLYQQLKWGLLVKPELRHQYVMEKIDEEFKSLYAEIDKMYESTGRTNLIVL